MGRGNASPSSPRGTAKKGGAEMNSFLLRKKVYSDPSKEALEAAREAKRRIHAKQASHGSPTMLDPSNDEDARREHERQLDLIGELKAAEARNRLRVVRLRYEANRTQEINHLVASQATALEAVRLKVILPPVGGPTQHERLQARDPLGKLERQRVERIIELPLDHFVRKA